MNNYNRQKDGNSCGFFVVGYTERFLDLVDEFEYEGKTDDFLWDKKQYSRHSKKFVDETTQRYTDNALGNKFRNKLMDWIDKETARYEKREKLKKLMAEESDDDSDDYLEIM